MKTFKDIVSEVAQPLAGDEKRFKEKHKVNTIGDPQNNGDKLYKGSEIKKDKTKKASYEDGEDTKVYVEVEQVEEGIVDTIKNVFSKNKKKDRVLPLMTPVLIIKIIHSTHGMIHRQKQ